MCGFRLPDAILFCSLTLVVVRIKPGKRLIISAYKKERKKCSQYSPEAIIFLPAIRVNE
jgi:hypothetical protein